MSRNRSLLNLLDYFSLPIYGKDPLSISRARAVVGTNFVAAVLFYSGMLFTLLANSMAEHSKLFAWGCLFPIGTLYIFFPFLIRHFNCLWLNQQLTLLFASLGVTAGVYTNGGPLVATNTELTLLTPTLAFFLLGTKGGLTWSLLTFGLQAIMYLLHINGFIFPNYQNPHSIETVAIFNWAVAFIAIIFLIMMIEVSRAQLEHSRLRERKQYQHLATHDPLTQIANRTLFEERLNSALANNDNANSQIILLYIDLDNFKPLNDEWGHAFGDKILQIFASRLLESTRPLDTVARLGGDEFAVLLTEIDTNTDINILVSSLYDRVTEKVHLEKKVTKIHCSIGICQYPENANNPEAIWQRADYAMYEAKKDPDTNWCVYSPIV